MSVFKAGIIEQGTFDEPQEVSTGCFKWPISIMKGWEPRAGGRESVPKRHAVIGNENSSFKDLIFIPSTDSMKLTKATNRDPWVPKCGVDFCPSYTLRIGISKLHESPACGGSWERLLKDKRRTRRRQVYLVLRCEHVLCYCKLNSLRSQLPPADRLADGHGLGRRSVETPVAIGAPSRTGFGKTALSTQFPVEHTFQGLFFFFLRAFHNSKIKIFSAL